MQARFSREVLGAVRPDEARERWIKWFEAARESGIPALIRFANLKEKRLDGLVAHARHNISTGRLEGFSSKMKAASFH